MVQYKNIREKYNSIKSKIDILSNQPVDVIIENQSLKIKFNP